MADMVKKTAVEIGEDLHHLIALNVPMTVDFVTNESWDAYFSTAYNGSWEAISTFVDPTVPVDVPSRDALTRLPAATEEELSLDEPRRALAVEVEALLGYSLLAREVKAPGRLRRVLAKLEISVLDEASVNTYKAQMVQHYASHKKMAQPTWRLTRLSDYKQPVPEYVLQKAVSIKRELPEAEFYIDQLAVDPFLIVALKPIKDHMVNQPSRVLDAEMQAYVEVWDEPKFEVTL